jgi:hypothetical protein
VNQCLIFSCFGSVFDVNTLVILRTIVMAGKGSKVLLGFEDESITEKHKMHVNFTTNKTGGKPVSNIYHSYLSEGIGMTARK